MSKWLDRLSNLVLVLAIPIFIFLLGLVIYEAARIHILVHSPMPASYYYCESCECEE